MDKSSNNNQKQSTSDKNEIERTLEELKRFLAEQDELLQDLEPKSNS